MKINKKISLFLIITLLVSLFTSCGKKVQVNAEDVRAYSDTILENILTAGNKDDYSAYSKDFSDKMKELINENNFKDQNKVIKDKIGDYVSKEFTKVNTAKEKGTNYIVVIYKTKYSNEPKDAMISITFREGDPDHKVEGLFMTSPKLAAK